MNLCTKFEVRIALPVPEIIGVPQKLGNPMDTPTLPKFLMDFCLDGPTGQTCIP